jgi:CheY-like chemotaxis protein
LASTDYRVAEAADGPEAVEVLASQLPDLVITELRPRHRDGLTLCVIKRENAATADIPILMTMLDGDSDVEVAGRFMGASVLVERRSPGAVATIARELILGAPAAQMTRPAPSNARGLQEGHQHASTSASSHRRTGPGAVDARGVPAFERDARE